MPKTGNGNMAVFTGNANPELARKVCEHLKLELGDITVGRFSEGEISVHIQHNVRGCDVFVVQPTCPPVNENMMELLIMLDAFRRASAKRITAVLPYFGYARQDRKDKPRVPITAKLVANLLTGAGASRVLTVDLHAQQIQGFFDIPVDHLYAVPVFCGYFAKKKLKDLCVVSPDVGGIKAARAYAKRLRADLAIVDKRRIDDKTSEVMHIMGDVKGRDILLVDDIAATAGSLVEAAAAVKKQGAGDIYAAVSHGILSGPAIERIEKSVLKELLITDSIPLAEEKKSGKIKVLSVSELLAEAINRIHHERSISSLFK